MFRQALNSRRSRAYQSEPEVELPAIAEKRLRELMAFRLLNSGQHRQARSDALGGVSGFHARIHEHYAKDWETLKDEPGFAGFRGHSALSMEFASLQRDLAAANRAKSLYASDVAISRGALSVMSGLAVESVRFVNRSKVLKAAGPVQLSGGDTAEALQAALVAADSQIDAVEHACRLRRLPGIAFPVS